MARGKKKESTLTPEEKLAQALVPVEEQPYKVPENWCWVKLSALSTLISKGTTPTGGKNAYVSEGVHFLRVENISTGAFRSQRHCYHYEHLQPRSAFLGQGSRRQDWAAGVCSLSCKPCETGFWIPRRPAVGYCHPKHSKLDG